MNLDTALTDARNRLAGTCDVERILTELGPGNAARLRTALDDPTVASEVIVAALDEIGCAVSMQAVIQHRAGDCP